MYDTVLLATDGSEGAAAVADHALSIAANHGAALRALYVVDRRVYVSALDDDTEALKADLRERGEAALREVGDAAADRGVAVETDVRHGDPTREIPAAADAADADLVVVGSHGKSPREKVQGLGSVSERVVKTADRPVLVVHIDADGGALVDEADDGDENDGDEAERQ